MPTSPHLSQLAYFLALYCFSLLKPYPAFALELAATPSATVRATVPSNTGPPTGDTIAPSVPILLRPVDGTYTNHARPEFVWLQSTDNSNSISYDLYLNHVATFLGINNYGSGLTSNYVSRLEDGSLRLLPTSNLQDGSYDWYVVAYDRSGNSRGSASWHLIIDTQPPLLDYLPPATTQGPAAIPLTFSSEPFVTIILVIYHPESDTTTTLTLPTQEKDHVTFDPFLVPGDYQLFVTATDLAGNTTTLPTIELMVTQGVALTPTIPLPPPFSPIKPIYAPPLSALPATAMLVATRVAPAIIYIALIALVIFILLISRRKANLRIIDHLTRRPLRGLTVTDSHAHTTITNSYGDCRLRALSSRSYLLITNHMDTAPLTLCLTQLNYPRTIIEL